MDLPRLSDERRRTETEVRKTFEAARPTVLGALLDAVAVAMGRVLTVKLASLPRMADFATWSVAAEPGLGWPSGSFLAAYGGNRRAARTAALDASVIVPAIRALVRHGAWQGTASDLLAALRSEAGEDATQHQGWPLSPRALTAELTRLAPGLRADGIIWERPGRTHGGARVHMLRAVPEETVTSVTSVTTVTADDEVGTAEHETRAGEGDGLGESSAGRVTVAAGRVTVLERGDGWDGLVASLPIGEPAPLTPPPIDQHALASAWDSEPRGEVSPSRERVPACRRVGLGARVMAPVVARVCSTCGEPLDPRSRADRRTCSTRCRVAAWRARGRAGASKPRAVVQQTIPTPGDGATGLAPVTSAPGAVAA